MAWSWWTLATDIARSVRPGLWQVVLLAILAGVLAGGCGKSGNDRPEQRSSGPPEESLPVPEGARSGVTGMPAHPGPGAIGPPDASAGDWTLREADDEFSAAGAAGEADVEDPAMQQLMPDLPHEPAPPPSVDEHETQEAVAVVREYYAALDAGSFAHAYRLWSDGGSASGRTPQQFADSFASTASRSVEILAPGPIEAKGDWHYIEVPVAVEEVRRDGRLRRQIGAYTLRRAMAGGAGAEQRAWRISSADLREVRP